MKVALLAGGRGTRLAEETVVRPKPMVQIGGRPILWHIMMHYYSYGFADFIIALGYKGDCIRRWVIDRAAKDEVDWNVDLVESGLTTNTGGRIKRLKNWIGNETFMLTWGDGVSNVDLKRLLAFHRAHGRLATMTVVHPPPRFGVPTLDGSRVIEFSEKPESPDNWINGAFFVLEPEVIDYIGGDDTLFEAGPLQKLARDGQLMAFKHHGFWQCMDTMREKKILEEIWQRGNAPWATWESENSAFSSPGIAVI